VGDRLDAGTVKRFTVIAALLGLSCATEPTPSPGPQPTFDAAALPVCEPASTIELEVVATNLDVPWDIAFLADGRLLIVERRGQILVLETGSREASRFAEIPVVRTGEGGLLGVDTATDVDGVEQIFVVGTFDVDSARNPLQRLLRRGLRTFTAEKGYLIETRILRITASPDEPPAITTLVDGIPANHLHVGGALRVGPDGELWIGTGDAGDPALAADPSSRAGKLLRYDRNGGLPRDNPNRRSPVFASGLRNVQGVAFRADEALPWVSDHGPTGLATEDRRTGHDEINRILPGAGYGWPLHAGRGEFEDETVPPFLEWKDAIAPAGLAFVREGDWAGDLIVTGLRARDVLRIAFDGDTPRCREPLLRGDFGRMRGVRAGPDGWIYVTTSNRDGRTTPDPQDDRILRFRPVTPFAPPAPR
jgi:aldose sugar dehydrogenase